jgi:hypothetical protein
MTMIAYAFLQYRRLKTARRKKKKQRASTATDFARRTPRHPRTHRSTTAAAMPELPKMDLQRAAIGPSNGSTSNSRSEHHCSST